MAQNDFSFRGFMVCYHQMHDFLPWFGPNLRALSCIINGMSEVGLNALLVEYETYYPWSGDLSCISCSDHLTEEEVLGLNREAAEHGIEIIPLVQVFGHMYHVLTHPEYSACAEDPDIPQQMCPRSSEAFELACKLIDDTLRLHPGCRHLHLGGDECELMGHCPKCSAYAAEHGMGALYVEYMGALADYALSKGVTPILWHDIALMYPECLPKFDSRVLFNFWHYGTASHGDGAAELEKLLRQIPASRIIGSPAARAEKQHGALHHTPSFVEANIRQLNRLMAEHGCLGIILTDWPDTGCPFFDSFYAMRAEGAASRNGGSSLRQFRRNYAADVFGVDAPELIDKLDAIGGSTISARGFQYRKAQEHNRYSREPFDFKNLCTVIRQGYDATEGGNELYRQVGQLGALDGLKELVAELLPQCRRNREEMEWYGVLCELTDLFLHIDIALRKECFVVEAFGTPTPAQIQRFESRAYAAKALEMWDGTVQHFKAFASHFVAARPLDNYCHELFPQTLKDGLREFIANGFAD